MRSWTKHIVNSLLSLLQGSPLCAQQLSGVVIDAETGEPIPYAEVVVGIHNIFKLLHVEYVRRLNYNDLPTAKKWGIRYTMRLTF